MNSQFSRKAAAVPIRILFIRAYPKKQRIMYFMPGGSRSLSFSAPPFTSPRKHAKVSSIPADLSATHCAELRCTTHAQARFVVRRLSCRSCKARSLFTGCRGFWKSKEIQSGHKTDQPLRIAKIPVLIIFTAIAASRRAATFAMASAPLMPISLIMRSDCARITQATRMFAARESSTGKYP